MTGGIRGIGGDKGNRGRGKGMGGNKINLSCPEGRDNTEAFSLYRMVASERGCFKGTAAWASKITGLYIIFLLSQKRI